MQRECLPIDAKGCVVIGNEMVYAYGTECKVLVSDGGITFELFRVA